MLRIRRLSRPRAGSVPLPAPIDGVWGEWGPWVPTSGYGPCIDGFQTRTERRTRTLIVPPQNGGVIIGEAFEDRVSAPLECTIVPPPDTGIPAAPTNLTYNIVSPTFVQAFWSDNSDNEDYFEFEYKIGAGAWTLLAPQGPNIPAFFWTAATPATTYGFRVRAVNAAGASPYSNEITVVMPAPAVPNAPSALIATAVSATQINLAWTDNSAVETGFKVERATAAGGPFFQVASLPENTTGFPNNTGLTQNTTYYYRVRAYATGAGDSAYTNTASATTQVGVVVPGEIVAIDLTFAAASGTHAFQIGQALPESAFPPSTTFRTDLPESQIIVETTWNDGSPLMLNIAGLCPAVQNVAKSVVISTGTPIGGTALTAASIVARAPTSIVAFDTVNVNLTNQLSTPSQIWAAGPKMIAVEYQVIVDPYVVRWDVWLWSDGNCKVAYEVSKGFLDNGAGGLWAGSPTTSNAFVSIGGVTVYNQSFTMNPHAPGLCGERWLGTDPQMTAAHDAAYLSGTKVVPNYGLVTTDPTAADLLVMLLTNAPGTRGNWHENQGSTGPQWQIGLLNGIDSSYVARPHPNKWRSMIANSLMLGNFAIQWLSKATGKTAMIANFPTWTINGPGGLTSTGTIAGPRVWDISHHGEGGAIPWLLTADHRHYRRMMDNAMTVVLVGKNTADNLFYTQSRGHAWLARTLGLAARFARTGDPRGAEFKVVLARQLDLWMYYKSLTGNNQLGFIFTDNVGAHAGGGLVSLFMQMFWISVMGYLSDLNFLSPADQARLITLRNFMYKTVVGIYGTTGGHCFVAAGVQSVVTVSTINYDISQWLQTWGEVYEHTYGVPIGTVCQTSPFFGDATSAADNFLGNSQPALSYAKDHNAEGIDASYTRFVNSPDYPIVAASATLPWGSFANFAVTPRNTFTRPPWRTSMVKHECKRLPNSNLASIQLASWFDPSIMGTGAGPTAMYTAFGGGVCIDRATGVIYQGKSGGHGDYGGNQIQKYDWRIPGWVALRGPTIGADVTENTYRYNDGSITSSHIYHRVLHDRTRNMIIYPTTGPGFGMAGGGGSNEVGAFDLGTNQFDPGNFGTFLSVGNDQWGCEDPTTGDFILGDALSGRVQRWNHDAGTCETLTTLPVGGTERSADTDTRRNRVLVIGGNPPAQFTMSLASPYTYNAVTLVGQTAAALAFRGMGMVFYRHPTTPSLDCYYVRRLEGPGDNYFFTISDLDNSSFQFTVSIFTCLGEGATGLSAPDGAPYTRFIGCDVLGVAFYLPKYNDPLGGVWALALD